MSKDVISEAMGARPRLGPCADSRSIAFSVFNTEIALTAYGEDRAALDEALALCRDRCVLFERLLSRTRADSDIARIRSGAPQAVRVAPETADVIRVAQRYCERSRGLFDITMGSVTSLWDFHAGVVPSKLSIARALEHVDYRKIPLGPSALEGRYHRSVSPRRVPRCGRNRVRVGRDERGS